MILNCINWGLIPGSTEDADLRFLLLTAINQLEPDSKNRTLDKLDVTNYASAPGAYPMAGPAARKDASIQLITDNHEHSAKIVYQFAHEYCHYMQENTPIPPTGVAPSQWFREVLCEVASLFALHNLASKWMDQERKTWISGKPEIWKDSIDPYAYFNMNYDAPYRQIEFPLKRWYNSEVSIGDEKRRMSEWLALRPSHLALVSIGRGMSMQRIWNDVPANHIFDIIKDHPEYWPSISDKYMPLTDRPFPQLIQEWYASKEMPESLRLFPLQISDLFGLSLIK